METPLQQQQQILHGIDQEGQSPSRFVTQCSPSDSEYTPRLSPHIRSILDRGLAENLSRILSSTKEPVQDSDLHPLCDVTSPERPKASIMGTLGLASTDGERRNSLQEIPTVADVDMSVAETIADLQELIFEWEDLYFEGSDVVPESTNPNLYVWALRGRRPVPISLNSITFGFGSVYIILHVKSFAPSPIMTCFYWTGHKAHFSAVACAAVHAVQLSRKIRCLKTSRQMEGIETADFYDAVGKFTVKPSLSEPALKVVVVGFLLHHFFDLKYVH
jgi:hypothetical protein